MGFTSEKFEKVLASLWNDRFTIMDHVSFVNTSGITEDRLEEIATDLLCKISYPSHNTTDGGTIDTNPIDWDIQLFCSPSVPVKKGQLITACRKSGKGETLAEYKGLVNEARIYGSHLELKIKFEGVA